MRSSTVLVIAAVLAAGTSSAAMARYYCVPGYTYRHGVCQPVRHLGYHNPVSGAVVGGALGTASGAVAGTGNMLTGH